MALVNRFFGKYNKTVIEKHAERFQEDIKNDDCGGAVGNYFNKFSDI